VAGDVATVGKGGSLESLASQGTLLAAGEAVSLHQSLGLALGDPPRAVDHVASELLGVDLEAEAQALGEALSGGLEQGTESHGSWFRGEWRGMSRL